MYDKEDFVCKNCGREFNPTNSRQKYCCRDCFLEDYKKKLKASDFPFYTCPNCENKIKLDFYPKQNIKKWDEFICPICGFKRSEDRIITEYIKIIALEGFPIMPEE